MDLSISEPSHPKHSYDPMNLKPSFAAALITHMCIFICLVKLCLFFYFLFFLFASALKEAGLFLHY